MLVEFSFTESYGEHKKCHIALCDEPGETITEVVEKFWNKHGIENGSFGSFVFHLNNDDEYIALTACTKINSVALEHHLNYLRTMIGVAVPIHELIEMSKRIGEIENGNIQFLS